MTIGTDERLLPCPFCGEDNARVQPNREWGDTTFEAFCKTCHATIVRDLEAHAVAMWNTRARTASSTREGL